MIYSDHAEKRMQQRAIPELAIELLQIYGCIEHSQGASIRYFDKRARQQVNRALKALVSDLDRLADLYIVESNQGVVVTAGHRIRPIRQHFKSGARQPRR